MQVKLQKMQKETSNFIEAFQSIIEQAAVNRKNTTQRLGRVGYVETVADGVVRVR